MPGGVESQAAAEEYLTKHNVVKIFERLSTALLYAKPADPLSFLQQEVRKLQEAQKKGEAVRRHHASALECVCVCARACGVAAAIYGLLTPRVLHGVVGGCMARLSRCAVSPRSITGRVLLRPGSAWCVVA